MISQAARQASVLLLSLALPHTLAAEEWKLVKKEPYRRLEFKYDADGNPVDLLHRSWSQAEALDVR